MMLAYHELSDRPENDVYALPLHTFRSHAALVAKLRGSLPALSFDDGHVSNFTLALPILQSLEVPAVFFVTTCWIDVSGSSMTWLQLRQLSQDGFTVASHTHTHPLLTHCGDAALENELTVSKQVIEDRLGKAVDMISLPGGRTDARILRACLAAGYTTVYTSRVGEQLPPTDQRPRVVGRYVVTRATTEQTLAQYLQGHPSTWRRLRFESLAKSWGKKLLGDGLYQRAWRRFARSRSYGT